MFVNPNLDTLDFYTANWNGCSVFEYLQFKDKFKFNNECLPKLRYLRIRLNRLYPSQHDDVVDKIQKTLESINKEFLKLSLIELVTDPTVAICTVNQAIERLRGRIRSSVEVSFGNACA